MKAHIYHQDVLFRHCDPAGIMFYPRILEMVNDAIEDFFETVLRWPYHQIHPDHAVPTAELYTKFVAPCRLSERLELSVALIRVGRSSMELETSCTAVNQLRSRTKQTLVCVDSQIHPTSWPSNVRELAETFLEVNE